MACSDVLTGGVFDTILLNRTDTLEVNIFNWLRQSTFQEVKTQVDAGLDVIGIFGANFDQQTFNQWKQDVNQGNITGINQDQSYQLVTRTASKVLADAWLECERGISGRGLISRVDPPRGGDQQQFAFSIRYIPNALDDAPPIIDSIQVGNGTLLPGGGISQGATVGFGGISGLIQRNQSGKERPLGPGVIEREIWGPVSITVNTEKGSTVDVVPPVTQQVVLPPPPPVAPIQQEFKYQISGSMSKDAGETGWFQHPAIFQLPPNCWIDTNRGGNISNPDIANIQPPKGFDIYFHDYPATLKRSVFAVSVNVVNGLVNVFVTLMGHDKVGRERYVATVTVYYACPGQ